MAQFARPDSNIEQTSITGGFADIDETSANDTDRAWGADNTTALLAVGLSNVTDPGVHTGHIVRWRWVKTDDGVDSDTGSAVSADVAIYDYSVSTTTAIAAKGLTALTGTVTADSITLTETEAGNIVDYTQLVLKYGQTASGGSPANRRGGAITWAEFEVPDAPTFDAALYAGTWIDPVGLGLPSRAVSWYQPEDLGAMEPPVIQFDPAPSSGAFQPESLDQQIARM